MDQGQQGPAYQALSRRDSDALLNSAEHGTQMPELEQDEAVLQKDLGTAASSPAASGTSPSTAEDDAAAKPPISEADQRQAWKLLDWAVAAFLCTSLVFLAGLRDVVANISVCTAVVVTVAYVWRRWQRRAPGGASVEALKAALLVVALGMGLTPLIQFWTALFWWLASCGDRPHCPAFTKHLIIAVILHILYGFACGAVGILLADRQMALFPLPPRPPPKRWDVEMREQALAYQPPSEQSRLEAEERAALREFTAAHAPDKKAAAHRRWQEVAKKLELLREDPQQYHQLYGQASAEA